MGGLAADSDAPKDETTQAMIQKLSSNQIYAFWLVESTSLESENKQALAAYEIMKTTLK